MSGAVESCASPQKSPDHALGNAQVEPLILRRKRKAGAAPDGHPGFQADGTVSQRHVGPLRGRRRCHPPFRGDAVVLHDASTAGNVERSRTITVNPPLTLDLAQRLTRPVPLTSARPPQRPNAIFDPVLFAVSPERNAGDVPFGHHIVRRPPPAQQVGRAPLRAQVGTGAPGPLHRKREVATDGRGRVLIRSRDASGEIAPISVLRPPGSSRGQAQKRQCRSLRFHRNPRSGPRRPAPCALDASFDLARAEAGPGAVHRCSAGRPALASDADVPSSCAPPSSSWGQNERWEQRFRRATSWHCAQERCGSAPLLHSGEERRSGPQ
jgi:hypothetical protein